MKIKLLHPLISCICITKNRPEMLMKVIRNFEQQNYPYTELVVSFPVDDSDTKKILDQITILSSLPIIQIERKSEASIGAARNQAVAACNGNYICFWDDDDIYQYTRIADQYNLLQGNGRYYQASMLNQIILYDWVNHNAFISHKANWAGTLLCKKEHLLNNPCSDSNHFECEGIINFLKINKLLMTDFQNPFLYIHVFHGANITEYFHSQYYTRLSSPLPEEVASDIQRYIDQPINLNIQ